MDRLEKNRGQCKGDRKRWWENKNLWGVSMIREGKWRGQRRFRNLRWKGREGWKTSKRTADSWTRKGVRGYNVRGKVRWGRQERGRSMESNCVKTYLQKEGMEASEWISMRRGSGGRSLREREGWEASGEINHQWPRCCNIEKSQWRGTKLSTHTLLRSSSPTSLSYSWKTPSPPFSPTRTLPVYRLLPPSLLTTPYIFQRFNTALYFSSS